VITRVWERLYLGSLKDAARLAAENPFGITAVVSLCSHKVPHKASGVSYTRVPIADSRPISAKQFDAVMAAIAEGVRNGKLFDPLCRRHESLTNYDGSVAAPLWMPQYRRGAARNSGATFDHRPVTRITAKRGRAPMPMRRAVLYSRVSRPDQNPEMQLLDLRRNCGSGAS